MNSILKKLLLGIFFSLAIYVGIQNFIKTMFTYKTSTYEHELSNGESIKIYLLPKNIIAIRKQYEDKFDYGVFQANGFNAVHYFGSIYNSGNTLISLKRYKNAKSVWKVNLELIKSESNFDNTSFPEIGYIYKHIFAFRENNLQIDEFIYKKVKNNIEDEKFISNITSNNIKFKNGNN